MQNNYSKTILVCFIVLFVAGCKRAPDHFPSVVPCNVTFQGKIVDEFIVFLTPETTEKRDPKAVDQWVCSGKTNSSGYVRMSCVQGTYMKYGVPEGKYKVTLSRKFVDPDAMDLKDYHNAAPEVKAAEDKRFMETYAATKPFPDTCASPVTTPLEITVTKGIKDYVIEIPSQ